MEQELDNFIICFNFTSKTELNIFKNFKRRYCNLSSTSFTFLMVNLNDFIISIHLLF